VQSAVFSQTTNPGFGQEVAHVVPVKPVHSVHVLPHELTDIGEPLPQQTGPAAPLTVQSIASSHCQSIEPVTGQAVPMATQVDGEEEPEGDSQQC
jgi:hypothetical protein